MQLPDYTCVLCTNGLVESLSHMLLQCPFAIQCQGLINLTIQQNLDPLQILQSFKDQLNVPFFMEAIIIMAWTIWSVRNDFIFRGINPSIQVARFKFRDEWRLLLYMTKSTYHVIIDLWTAELLQLSTWSCLVLFSLILSLSPEPPLILSVFLCIFVTLSVF